MSATTFVRDVAWVVAVVVAVTVHLVLGYIYVVSGLAVPVAVVVLLLIWWAVLAWRLARFVVHRSWWVVAPPLVAVATLYLVLTVGDRYLGWTA